MVTIVGYRQYGLSHFVFTAVSCGVVACRWLIKPPPDRVTQLACHLLLVLYTCVCFAYCSHFQCCPLGSKIIF